MELPRSINTTIRIFPRSFTVYGLLRRDTTRKCAVFSLNMVVKHRSGL